MAETVWQPSVELGAEVRVAGSGAGSNHNPIPAVALLAAVAVSVAWGWLGFAVMLLLAFDCCLRHGDFLQLRR